MRGMHAYFQGGLRHRQAQATRCSNHRLERRTLVEHLCNGQGLSVLNLLALFQLLGGLFLSHRLSPSVNFVPARKLYKQIERQNQQASGPLFKSFWSREIGRPS